MNILIIKLSAIGDVIHALPSLTALRRCYPESDITWVVEEEASDLLKDHPDLDRVIVSGRKRWIKEFRKGRLVEPIREMRSFLQQLRSRRYDLVIDFHGLLKSALIVLISGGKRKLGYDSLQEFSGFFYNEKIPEIMEKHAVDRYLDFVYHVVGESQTVSLTARPEFEINVGKREKRRVSALLDAHADTLIFGKQDRGDTVEQNDTRTPPREGRFIAVSPIALWETKLWDNLKFAELCDRIRLELKIGVILTGNKAGPLDPIQSRMKTTAANLGGQTSLRELAALYRKAALVVTTDSGPMHLASAVGTPVVAIFGPTDPSRTGPYGPGNRVISRNLSCMPCFRKHCKSRQCMLEIDVDEVFNAVKEMLLQGNITQEGNNSEGTEKRKEGMNGDQ